MANLRELLGRETLTSVQSGTSIKGLNDGKTFIFHPYCNLNNCEQNYHDYCINFWCVPCGTTHITFEIWGGGGSGAGACCCQQGHPGGSGAYARKTLQYPQIQGGWCYGMVVASPTCCSACCCGIRGCKSYITGCNLSNFCAEGGLPGRTDCFSFWSICCNGRISTWNLLNDCACAFGADCIIPGRPGYFENFCNCDNCWTKLGIPYPAKIINDRGGYMSVNNWCNRGHNTPSICQGTTPYSFNTNCNRTLPGSGTPSATSCGGGCCYGWPGNGGLIKITYCSCWIGVDGNCSYHFYN